MCENQLDQDFANYISKTTFSLQPTFLVGYINRNKPTNKTQSAKTLNMLHRQIISLSTSYSAA